MSANGPHIGKASTAPETIIRSHLLPHHLLPVFAAKRRWHGGRPPRLRSVVFVDVYTGTTPHKHATERSCMHKHIRRHAALRYALHSTSATACRPGARFRYL